MIEEDLLGPEEGKFAQWEVQRGKPWGLQAILVRWSTQIYSKLKLLVFTPSSSNENHQNKARVWCGFL